MSIGVYQIEINGKKYIGSAAKSISRRWSNHLSELRRGVHGNSRLQRAFNKYGEDNVHFSILEIAENPEDCIIIEQKYIDTVRPELNLCPIARSCLGIKRSEEVRLRIGAVSRGRKHSEETRAKISIATLGRTKSQEARRKLSASLIGHTVSEGVRAKLRAFRTGKPGPTKGRKLSEETRAKMSAAKKGKTTWNKGIAHSDEAKKKMSLSHMGNKSCLGRVVSEETRRKLSAANSGRKHTDERKAKMSAASKKNWEIRRSKTTSPSH